MNVPRAARGPGSVLRLGLVGAGPWGRNYVRTLKRFAGARPLDSEADWEKVRPGDIAVFAETTTNFRPKRSRRVNVERRGVSCYIPLRLISGFGGEGGFYSNISGFLPFSLSMEPVEEFTVVEPL